MSQLILFSGRDESNACLGVCILDLQDLKAFGVNTLVRVCAATYDKTPVEQEGIQILVSDAVESVVLLVF